MPFQLKPALRSMIKLSLCLFLLSSCAGPTNHDTAGSESDSTAFSQTYHFLKVYRTPVADTVYTDSTAITFSVDDDGKVEGNYRWVIPGKDGKSGDIHGDMARDTVFGHYHYQQEGGTYTDSIQVVLQQDRVIVIQFNADQHTLRDTLGQK